jgi:hypothetical protein
VDVVGWENKLVLAVGWDPKENGVEVLVVVPKPEKFEKNFFIFFLLEK